MTDNPTITEPPDSPEHSSSAPMTATRMLASAECSTVDIPTAFPPPS